MQTQPFIGTRAPQYLLRSQAGWPNASRSPKIMLLKRKLNHEDPDQSDDADEEIPHFPDLGLDSSENEPEHDLRMSLRMSLSL